MSILLRIYSFRKSFSTAIFAIAYNFDTNNLLSKLAIGIYPVSYFNDEGIGDSVISTL